MLFHIRHLTHFIQTSRFLTQFISHNQSPKILLHDLRRAHGGEHTEDSTQMRAQRSGKQTRESKHMNAQRKALVAHIYRSKKKNHILLPPGRSGIHRDIMSGSPVVWKFSLKNAHGHVRKAIFCGKSQKKKSPRHKILERSWSTPWKIFPSKFARKVPKRAAAVSI